jgi:hypothetical protein
LLAVVVVLVTEAVVVVQVDMKQAREPLAVMLGLTLLYPLIFLLITQ